MEDALFRLVIYVHILGGKVIIDGSYMRCSTLGWTLV